MKDFGVKRVLEPKGFIPTTAWRLDNRPEISPHEIRIRVKQIKLEEGSFRQYTNEYDYDEDKIKNRIYDIVKKRGKLHNPSTDSAGICYGVIEQIGEEYGKDGDYKVGDRIICITSLTALPLKIDYIGKIDFNYAQITVEGYAILFETSSFIHMPENLELSYTLSAMDEAGSINKAYRLARGTKRVLLLGSSLLNILLYSAAVRKAVGKNGHIVVIIDKESTATLKNNEINKLLEPYVDDLYIMDILSPVDNFKWFEKKEPEGFDLSVNCADLLGAEAISVMLTKDKGTLFFATLINNYNLAILFAEALGKDLNTVSLEEFTSEFPSFTQSLMTEVKEDLKALDRLYTTYKIIKQLPTKISELLRYQKAGRIDDFVFASEKTRSMLNEVLNIAEYDCNVVIQGETGVGKERILGLIHKNSSRKLNPCIRINCAAIQESLAESEFFGYESGAFTGANSNGKPGYFELANNGILFLDEVGELPLNLQSKLLRALQEKQFYRVGGSELIKVNVRVICASNVDLRELVRDGKFREDLYYRLNVCEISIPPLRERKQDIVCLAEQFIEVYNGQYHVQKKMGQDALMALEQYSWPGNVRELDNTIHRAMIGTRKDIIDSDIIEDAISKNLYGYFSGEGEVPSADNMNQDSMKGVIESFEKESIAIALKEQGTTRSAADSLGITQSQLMRRKKKYGL